ncbi:DUF2780 domain-containing protein [Vibrio sp. SCSIO 43137]|uniref:DUF2780 domain-containing protein n=1 Tax=Vibrio sp. SCSIO 43137 TaxID=3021011 RepID=UPI002307AAC0|nr:DUF2780 domain-containing protein [Vibrio sp. SCSIO 43137]WCE29448.1 DUF2780 domain-containing protein [Vibrio sp. SCSIO 43137]
MKNVSALLAITTLCLSYPSYALFGLGSDSNSDKKLDSSALTSLAGTLTGEADTQNSSPIVDMLSGQLGVSTQQATGGAGALLALASNSLSESDSSELSSLIPGMSALQNSAPGLMGMATNLSAVNNVFSSLGLDPAMVSQFAPLILQYLTSQGASSGLLSSLGSLWGS